MARVREQLRLPASTAVPVRHGHPWVFGDMGPTSATGEPVDLVDADGVVIGWGLVDEGDIVVRVMGLGAGPPDVAALIEERIRRADAFRVRMIDVDTDAYRVINGAGDGLPGLVVDRYAGLAVVRIYGACWVPWLDTLRDTIAGLPWVESVGRKLGVARVDGSKGLEMLAGPSVDDLVIVQESGMRLLVRPHSGQKTGTFLDQRVHRALVGGWASGRTVANLFSYTGGFSVAAALGGAAHVTTVDIAPEAIEDAQENFRLNGLDPSDHAFVAADVFAWRPRGKVDLLIVDPPSFARGKRSQGAARSAYRKLHRRLGSSVSRDGLLATASCTAWISEPEWRDAVAEGLQGHGLWSWLWRSGTPPDHPLAVGHPEAAYLKFALLRRLG